MVMSNLIREARTRHAVAVRELARRCDVSPATVQDWERAERRDAIQLSTLKRALQAMGEEPVIRGGQPAELAGRFDRLDQRLGLELHRKVAGKLIDNPDEVLDIAARRIPRLVVDVNGPLAEGWVDEWRTLIESRDLGSLIDVMLGGRQRDIDMRQVSPFDNQLTPEERIQVLERARA
jgi:transcriptional regulator with XRE-family HTH domain